MIMASVYLLILNYSHATAVSYAVITMTARRKMFFLRLWTAFAAFMQDVDVQPVVLC